MSAQRYRPKTDVGLDFGDWLDEYKATFEKPTATVVEFPPKLAARGPERRQTVLDQSLDRMRAFEAATRKGSL
jgi:hypothetical protein